MDLVTHALQSSKVAVIFGSTPSDALVPFFRTVSGTCQSTAQQSVLRLRRVYADGTQELVQHVMTLLEKPLEIPYCTGRLVITKLRKQIRSQYMDSEVQLNIVALVDLSSYSLGEIEQFLWEKQLLPRGSQRSHGGSSGHIFVNAPMVRDIVSSWCEPLVGITYLEVPERFDFELGVGVFFLYIEGMVCACLFAVSDVVSNEMFKEYLRRHLPHLPSDAVMSPGRGLHNVRRYLQPNATLG